MTLAREATHPTVKRQISASIKELLEAQETVDRLPYERLPFAEEEVFRAKINRISRELDEIDIRLSQAGPEAVWVARTSAVGK